LNQEKILFSQKKKLSSIRLNMISSPPKLDGEAIIQEAVHRRWFSLL